MITERREHGVWKTGLWFIFKYFERSSLGDTFHFVTLPDSDSYSDIPGICGLSEQSWL